MMLFHEQCKVVERTDRRTDDRTDGRTVRQTDDGLDKHVCPSHTHAKHTVLEC